MGSHLTKARRPDRGQATLEFALVLPLLCVLLFLVFESGRLFGTWLLLTNAVRESARYASVQVTNTSADSYIMYDVARTAYFIGVSEVACQASGQPPTGDTSCIEITHDTTDHLVTVFANYELQTLMPIDVWVPFLGTLNYPGTIDLSAASTMRTEQ